METQNTQPPRHDAVAPCDPPAHAGETPIQSAAGVANPQPFKPPRRRRRWPLYGGLGFLAVLVGVPLLGYLYFASMEDRELTAIIAEIEKTDPRWRFDDIIADRKTLPDDENPAVVVGKIDALLRAQSPNGFDLGGKSWRQFENLPSVNQLNALQKHILEEAFSKHGEAVKLARTLRHFPGEGRYPIKYTGNALTFNVEPLQRSRGIMNLLNPDVMLRAEEGDEAGALESCHAILVTARSIGDEPYLIAALVRYAGEAVAVSAIERALAQGDTPPADQLKALQDLLATEIDAPILVNAMRGERGAFDGLIAEVHRGNIKASGAMGQGGAGGGGFEDWLLDTFPRTILRGRHEYLRLMTKNIDAARLPSEKQGEVFAKIDAEVRSSRSVVVRFFMPATQKVSESHRRTRGNLRCTMVGIAAERYRLAYGQWPDSIEKLVKSGLLSAVPLDPYDGQPVRYKLLADGVMIYVVGPDGVDNGGVIDRDHPMQPGTDQGFRLWDVAARRQAPLPPRPLEDGDQP